MPTQVQRRPSEPLSPHVGSRDHFVADHDVRGTHQASVKQQQQQQLQHREALRLALGSILTPKRPPLSTSSRSSSGTASPAYFGMHSASGAHTPIGTPPVSVGSYFPPAHGPNSSEHLHLHPHGHHAHPLPPSRLRPSRSTSSDTPSPTGSSASSTPNSSHPSPYPGMGNPNNTLPIPPDIEPLPPAAFPQDADMSDVKPTRPPIQPLQAKEAAVDISMASETTEGATGDGGVGNVVNQAGSGSHTPKAKFLQTLQSKSAWDALIHGSFS